MNLATRFPSVYWACACLSVNAKQSGGDDEDAEVVSNGTSDYGKITKAISKMQLQHIKVDLPDINLSAVDFKPVAKENKILFGLGGLKGVSTDYFKTIIAGRPYKNFKDFYDRIELPTTQMIALIKSGAFNKIEEGKSRRDILMDYFGYEMDKNPSYNKEKITMANFSKIANSSNIPDTLKPLCKLYYYKEYLEDNTYKLIKDEDNIDVARSKIKNNIPTIKENVNKIFKENNYTMPYDINYGYNYFPEKQYRGIKYNEGYYESIVISIGDAKGDNWWCVLFPNLCLADYESNDENEYKLWVAEKVKKIFN